jgi:protein required for attachment to host cells
VANAGDEPSVVLHDVEGNAEPVFGYNAATREFGDMIAMGVIDPAKVTRLALQNAVSISGLPAAVAWTGRWPGRGADPGDVKARHRTPRGARPALSPINGSGGRRSIMSCPVAMLAPVYRQGIMMTMNRPTVARRPVRLDWVVVANAARARVFERDGENGAMREIADPVHPASREKEAALGRDRPGRAHKGVASTAFEPHTAPHARERARFAHELAQMLEEAALARHMPGLVLMASDQFLGELKAVLGPASRAILTTSVALDLTSLQGSDLEHRVSKVLSEHGAAAPEAAETSRPLPR